MAIYSLRVTPVSRSRGQSAAASAAYRSATRIKDERTRGRANRNALSR
jgi:hypothetical protein